MGALTLLLHSWVYLSCFFLYQDHPEHGILFLVRELLNVIQDYTWEDNSDDKIRIYTSVLHLLSAMSQDTYLYHIDKGTSIPTSPQQAPISWTAKGLFHRVFLVFVCTRVVCTYLCVCIWRLTLTVGAFQSFFTLFI